MSLVYSLKLICDLCFYLSYAGLICSMATGNGFFATLPYLFSCAFLSGILAEKGILRLLPLVLIIPALFVLKENVWHYLFFIPACAYVVYYVYSLPYDVSSMEYSATYNLYFTIAFPVSIIVFLLNKEIFEKTGIPYALMFIVSSIVLMRMLRHDKDILNQTRFKIMNTLSVLSVMAIGALAGSKQFLGFIGNIIKTIYFTFIVPVITFLFMVLMYVLTPVFNLFSTEPIALEFDYDQLNLDSAYDAFKDVEPNEAGISLVIFRTIFFVSLFLIAVYLLYRLFKHFTTRYEARPSVSRQERIFLDKGKLKKKEPRINHQIRLIYRKFMKLCAANGIIIYPHSTTEDIAKQAGNVLGEKDSSFLLRNIYIESRYGEVSPTKENIKQSQEIYNKLKKNAAIK